jgi:hypothetical protein
MKAIQVADFGGYDALRLVDAPAAAWAYQAWCMSPQRVTAGP